MKKNKLSSRFPGNGSLMRYELKGSLRFFVFGMVLSAAAAVIDLINPRVVSCVIDYILGSEALPAEGVEPAVIRLLGGRDWSSDVCSSDLSYPR